MEKQKILEGNKLIAEFMGYVVLEAGYRSKDLERNELQIDDLKYQKSWDCLMPVVEKIEKYVCKYNLKERFCMGMLSILTPIEDVYKEVIEFIKWYNKNNK